MATSPNYGWLEPDNTDLVKNGALAIRTLGNAIDTTMATMTPKSIVDAKGDLIAASAADTPARLAVGNNGETLVADSSATTGLRYQAPVAVNPVVNGGFDVWQRSTSAAATTGYTYQSADRWQFAQVTTAASTISRQTSSLEGIQYCLRMQRNSGATSTGSIITNSSLESANCYAFAGKTVTFSFYARAGANYSSASNGLQWYLFSGTGTDQNVGTAGFTGQVTATNGTATLTTSWQRFQGTATLGSTVTQLAPWFQYTPSGTAGAADFVEITGVQIEVGSVATPFRRAGGTFQGELAACQRYYFRNTANSDEILINYAFAASSGFANGQIQYPVTMRVVPTAVETSNIKFVNYAGSSFAMSSIGFNERSASAGQVYGSVTGATAGHAGKIMGSATGAYVGISAEL